MAFDSVWTKEMDAIATNITLTAKEAGEKLGRTEEAVKSRRHKLGFSVRKARADSGKGGVLKPSKKKLKTDTVGGRIKMLRIAANINQNDLAMQLGYTFKNPGCVISDYERNVYKPSDEKLQILATIFNVTPDYILNGEEKKEVKEIKEPEVKEETKSNVKVIPVTPLPDPQPVKTALTNSEGYIDSTAMKAIALVMNEKKKPEKDKVVYDIKPGEVYLATNANCYLLALNVLGSNVLCTNLLVRDDIVDNFYYSHIVFDEKSYYVNLSRIFTRKAMDLVEKKGTVSEYALKCIRMRLKAHLGFNEAPKIEEKEAALDPASIIFADSISYFNEKNGTNFDLPKGNILLQDAIDISEKMGIELKELIRDHTDDRILDEVCKLEEERKAIDEKIKALQEKIGLTA